MTLDYGRSRSAPAAPASARETFEIPSGPHLGGPPRSAATSSHCHAL